MTLARAIARRILAIDTPPADATHWATIAVLDTIGVALAGSTEPAARIAAAHAAPGPCAILGTVTRATPLDAAMANGTAAHVLDFDCVADTMAGHPTVQLIPALLALGDLLDCTGADLLAAVVAGLETQARIARGITPSLGAGGWFTTSTIGTIGTAAACAHLLRLDEGRTTNALSLAANFASGLLANAGSMAKSLAAGHSARSGLHAALLARDGATAAADVFEHQKGFLAAFSPAGRHDREAMLRNWGAPFDVVSPGLWFKRYPCCGIAAAPIDLLLDLRARHAIGAIADIEVLLHPQRVAHVNRPDPRHAIDAAFSIQYCLSRALADGAPTLAHFTDTAIHDPALRHTMQRIAVHPDPEADSASTRYGEQFGARMRVTTQDGQAFRASAASPLGHSPANPLPDTALDAKFLACATRAMPPRQAADLLARLRNLAAAGSIRAITAISG